jgi:hypothetical protein
MRKGRADFHPAVGFLAVGLEFLDGENVEGCLSLFGFRSAVVSTVEVLFENTPEEPSIF